MQEAGGRSILRAPQPTDLTDVEWHLLRTLLPPVSLHGSSERDLINDILAVLSTGRTWRDVGTGLSDAAYRYCRHWRTHGMWEALRLALREPRMLFATWAVESGRHGTSP